MKQAALQGSASSAPERAAFNPQRAPLAPGISPPGKHGHETKIEFGSELIPTGLTKIEFGSELEPGQSPRYEPHLLDSDAGVGTQVVVADVNEDGLPDILTAARAGAFLFLNQ